jgi:translation elongation factor EF-1beta
MDQWIEKVPEWTENAGMDNIEKWLGGDNNVNMNNIDNEIRTSMIVEVDCERRTVEKIKKYGLQSLINIDEYIKKSNAYVLFYLWMRKNRKWYTVGKEPYNIPEIINIMPNKFDIDYSKMTPEIEKKFDSYLK